MTTPQDSVSDVERAQWRQVLNLAMNPGKTRADMQTALRLIAHTADAASNAAVTKAVNDHTVASFYDAVKGYSYPHGREVIVRIHGSGWDVYDPDKHPARAALAVPINKIGEDAEADAFLVEWQQQGETWVHAHADEPTAVDQARRKGGTCTPLYRAPAIRRLSTSTDKGVTHVAR